MTRTVIAHLLFAALAIAFGVSFWLSLDAALAPLRAALQ